MLRFEFGFKLVIVIQNLTIFKLFFLLRTFMLQILVYNIMSKVKTQRIHVVNQVYCAGKLLLQTRKLHQDEIIMERVSRCHFNCRNYLATPPYMARPVAWENSK